MEQTQPASIYVVTNTVNGKLYIGQTWLSVGHRWRTHCYAARTICAMRSNMAITNAIRKYGEKAFAIETLCELVHGASQADVDLAEERAIHRLNALVPHGYNLRCGGARGRVHQDTKARLSAVRKALHLRHSPEHKARLSLAMRGRPVTWGHKIAAALKGRRVGGAEKGRVLSAETRAKISAAHKGRSKSPETLAKIAAKLRGRKLTSEHRARISQGLRASGSLKGRVFTPEWKAKLSASRRRRTAEGRDPQRALTGGQWIRAGAESIEIPAHI